MTSPLLALVLVALFVGDVRAADIRIGYLGLANDPRGQADVAYTNIQLAPPDDPLTGAQLGLLDEKVVADAIDDNFTLDAQRGENAADLIAKARNMSASGERFVILDLPDDLVDRVAASVKDLKLTLINATAHAAPRLRPLAADRITSSPIKSGAGAGTLPMSRPKRDWISPIKRALLERRLNGGVEFAQVVGRSVARALSEDGAQPFPVGWEFQSDAKLLA